MLCTWPATPPSLCPLSLSLPHPSKRTHKRTRTNTQVGTPGLQAAHSYVWAWAQQLRDDAQEKGLIVEIAWEGYSGSTEMSFAGERFLNAWNNISNIVVHISAPCDSGEPDCGRGSNAPAVMLVAHHDSPVGSLGTCGNAVRHKYVQALNCALTHGHCLHQRMRAFC